jgi:hypothetical protein
MCLYRQDLDRQTEYINKSKKSTYIRCVYCTGLVIDMQRREIIIFGCLLSIREINELSQAWILVLFSLFSAS